MLTCQGAVGIILFSVVDNFVHRPPHSLASSPSSIAGASFLRQSPRPLLRASHVRGVFLVVPQGRSERVRLRMGDTSRPCAQVCKSGGPDPAYIETRPTWPCEGSLSLCGLQRGKGPRSRRSHRCAKYTLTPVASKRKTRHSSRLGNTLAGWHRQTRLTVQFRLSLSIRSPTGKRVCPCYPSKAPGLSPQDGRN